MADLEGTLGKFAIESLPPTVYYIPEFVSEEEEVHLLKQINSAPKPKWTCLSNRQLQNWGGLPHAKGMVPEKIPQWLDAVGQKIAKLGIFEDHIPNHVLVNEYLSGQGIMPHEDGPLYFPAVSNVTLGSHGVLDLYKPIKKSEAREPATEAGEPVIDKEDEQISLDDRYMGSMLLERRSLFLMTDDMYRVYLHGIQERTQDTIDNRILNLDRCSTAVSGNVLQRDTRVSLTIRYVPKVLKVKLMFGAKR